MFIMGWTEEQADAARPEIRDRLLRLAHVDALARAITPNLEMDATGLAAFELTMMPPGDD